MAQRPGRTSRSTGELTSHFLAVFTGSGRRTMYKQRSMIVTRRTKPDIRSRIDELMSDIRERGFPDWKHCLYDREEIGEANQTLVPEDPTIFAIDQPIVLAKKSQATGKVYFQKEFTQCPETGRDLIPIIQSKDE